MVLTSTTLVTGMMLGKSFSIVLCELVVECFVAAVDIFGATVQRYSCLFRSDVGCSGGRF